MIVRVDVKVVESSAVDVDERAKFLTSQAIELAKDAAYQFGQGSLQTVPYQKHVVELTTPMGSATVTVE